MKPVPSHQLIQKCTSAPARAKHAAKPTPSEAALFKLLRRNALGFKVKRQVVIGGYIVDLLVASVGLVIEIDGSVHYGQELNDARRQRDLVALGFEVVRFSAQSVMTNTVGVAARIGEHVLRLQQLT
ncbi:DUF559 domain-containing protein [soil metagenome]